jgi:hypothetical protein
MTEPDPVAALAAELAELCGQVGGLLGQLARAQGDIGVLRERLQAETGQTAMLRLQVKQFREELAEAVDRNRLKPPPAPWWRVSETEGRAMLAELREWVDTFLRPHYPDYLAKLPGCALAHGEAVWELSTLRAEWVRVYGDEDNRDLRGALAWHDRWLPNSITRLVEAIKCDETGCRMTRPRIA